MTKEELIQMLEEKRKIVAPVDVAYQNLLEESAKYQKFSRFEGIGKTFTQLNEMRQSGYWSKWGEYNGKQKFRTIFTIVIFAYFLLQILAYSFSGGNPLPLIVMYGAILGGCYYLEKIFVIPAREKFEAAQTLYEEEVNNPTYIAGKKGFPEQFYNYTALYRLGKLLEEGRADDLKEAFNLLESQQYNETQIGMQEEMRTLQKDIANSARIAAIASTVAAFNSFNRR